MGKRVKEKIAICKLETGTLRGTRKKGSNEKERVNGSRAVKTWF